MNKEQQRIAIAEACGWTECQLIKGYDGEQDPYGVAPNKSPILRETPDYLNDLNAMHEAERMLYARPNKTDGKVWAYVYENHLINITTTEIIATAAQRAEAFLKTLNLWKS